MQFLNFVALLSCQVALGSSFSISNRVRKPVKRDVTDATLYAYGTNTTGWPISYNQSDHLLYIAATANDTATGLTQVLFDVASITSENWQANATLANGTSVGSLYIIAEAFDAVGVRDAAGVLEVNGTNTGFGLFATQLAYNNNSYLEAQFWARATTTEGVYALMWNTVGDLEDDSFPVTVKAVENS